jgi:putative transcriptional regulator
MMSLRGLILVILMAASPAVWAQTPAVGRVLVSTPEQDDPNFSESVLLILVHENGSSAAIFLNRPTWVDPNEAYPDVDGLETYPGALYLGGPVAPDQMLTLFEHDGAAPVGARNVFGNIYFSPTAALFADMDLTAEDAPRVRVFAGHAQWAPGQLEAEIDAGDWRVLDAESSFVFAEDAAGLWERMPPSSSGVSASLNPAQFFSIE